MELSRGEGAFVGDDGGDEVGGGDVEGGVVGFDAFDGGADFAFAAGGVEEFVGVALFDGDAGGGGGVGVGAVVA